MKIKIYIPKFLHLISDWDWLRDYKNVKIKSNIIPMFYLNLNIYVTKLAPKDHLKTAKLWKVQNPIAVFACS